MATKHKGPRVNRARPVVRTPAKTDAQRVELTHGLSATMQANPAWGQATDVRPALVRALKDADDIAANVTVIEGLRNQLRDAMTKQGTLRRDWDTSMRSLRSTVEVFAAGSVDVVAGLGFDLPAAAQTTPATAPADLHVNTGKLVGQVAV